MSDATPDTSSDTSSSAAPDATSTGTIYKTLTWMLVVALVGLYALYSWYDGRLKQGLAGKDAEVADVAQRLSAAEASLRAAANTEAGLNAEIARLTSEAQAAAASAAGALDSARQELAALQARQDASAQELTARQSEIDRLTQELAQAATLEQGLKGELEAAAQVRADQESRLEGAEQRAAALSDVVEGHKRALSEADAKHAAELQALEAGLKGRIDYYRTALEGSEPERASLIAGLQEQAQSGQAALEQAQQALKEREQALMARLDEATREAQVQAAALQSAKESHAGEMRGAQGTLFAQEQELKRLQGELAHFKSRLDGTIADYMARLESSEAAQAATKQELEAAILAASQERERLEGQVQEAQARVAALEASLETERAQAKRALAEQRRQAEEARAAERQAGEQALASTRGLYSRYAELGARQTDRGMLLKLAEADLRFPSGSAVLPRGELPSLDRIAELLKDHPKLSALIEGHTDNAGPDELNLEVSRARAEAVKQALIARGVPEERVSAEGAGEGRPIADNATAAGRSQNRRVEVYVLERSE